MSVATLKTIKRNGAIKKEPSALIIFRHHESEPRPESTRLPLQETQLVVRLSLRHRKTDRTHSRGISIQVLDRLHHEQLPESVEHFSSKGKEKSRMNRVKHTFDCQTILSFQYFFETSLEQSLLSLSSSP